MVYNLIQHELSSRHKERSDEVAGGARTVLPTQRELENIQIKCSYRLIHFIGRLN